MQTNEIAEQVANAVVAKLAAHPTTAAARQALADAREAAAQVRKVLDSTLAERR